MSHMPKTHTCFGGWRGGMTTMILEDIMIKMTETRSHTAVPYLGLVSKK